MWTPWREQRWGVGWLVPVLSDEHAQELGSGTGLQEAAEAVKPARVVGWLSLEEEVLGADRVWEEGRTVSQAVWLWLLSPEVSAEVILLP